MGRSGAVAQSCTTRVDVVLIALREAAFRDDLPEVDRTISLYAESRHHRLVYPVLASIDLLQAEAPTRLDHLSAAQRRKILAVRYCVADTANQETTAFCHDRWLKDDPDLAFDVLYGVLFQRLEMETRIRQGLTISTGLSAMSGKLTTPATGLLTG